MDILFLDIDFVLNSHKFEMKRTLEAKPYTPYYSDIDPDCIILLNRILKARPQLKIVISSAWRADVSLEKFKEIFSFFGVNECRIIDTTSSDVEKSVSIRKWVTEKNPSNFIILDDDSLFDTKDPLFKNFYKVFTSGLQPSDVSKILKMI